MRLLLCGLLSWVGPTLHGGLSASPIGPQESASAADGVPNPSEIARKALAAHAAGQHDVLRRIAERTDVDPIAVADAMVGRYLTTPAEQASEATRALSGLRAYSRIVSQNPDYRELPLVIDALEGLSEERRVDEARHHTAPRESGPTPTHVRFFDLRAQGLAERGQWPDSAQFWELAAQAAAELDWAEWAGSLWSEAAREWASRGDFRNAVRCWEVAAPFQEECEDAAGLAKTLHRLGFGCIQLGHLAEALPHLERARGICEATGEQALLGWVLTAQGQCLHRMGRLEEAEQALRRALDVSAAVDDLRCQSVAEDALGCVCRALGDHPRAIELFELALSHTRGDPLGTAGTRANKASTLYDMGQFQEALDVFLEVARVQEDLGSPIDAAQSLGNAGNCHMELGNVADALRLQEQALPVLFDAGRLHPVAGFAWNLGQLHHDCGNYRRAAELFRLCMEIQQQQGIGDPVELLYYLAHYLGHLGEYEEAEATLRRAMELVGDDRQWRADLQSNLAQQLMWAGDLDRCIETLEEALETYQELGIEDPSGVITYGEALGRSGRYEEARTVLEGVLERSVDDRRSRSRALHHLSLVEMHLGGRGLELSREVLELERTLGRGLAEDGFAYRNAVRDSADVFLACAWAQLNGSQEPSPELLAEAFAVSEFSRGQVLVEGILSREALLEAQLPEELVEAEHEARARAEEAQAALARLAAADPSEAQLEEAREEFDQAYFDLEEVIGRIRREDQHLAGVAFPEPVALADLQAALAEDEAFLSYRLVMGGLLCFVVTPEHAALRHLGDAVEVEQRFDAFRSLVTQPDADDTVLARELDQLLIEPLAADLDGARRLFVSTDGSITFLPLEALVRPDGSRLVEQWEVVYVPSASVWTLLRDEAAERPAGRGILALGDPVYPQEDSDPATARGVTGEMAMRGLSGLTRLTASAEEARTALRGYPEEHRTLLLREDATRAGLQSALQSLDHPLAVLHLACHGHLDLKRPWLTGLVLTDGEMLTLGDLSLLSAPADLAVLSACQTGVGRLSKSEGVLGLVRGFFHAGCQRVIVSNWRVGDVSTREFMAVFYGQLSQGKSASAALRATKLQLLGDGVTTGDWAGFVLWGLAD